MFAGQRDDPFFVDLNVFDLLAVPPADTNNTDSLAGYNVHTIAIEVPIAQLTANGTRPASASDPNAVIGVWSTASRPSVTVAQGRDRKSGAALHSGLPARTAAGQRSRHSARGEGPLQFPGADEDGAALPYVLDPEVPKLLSLLFGIQSPPSPRNDLVTIFLTGIPGLNQPPECVPRKCCG